MTWLSAFYRPPANPVGRLLKRACAIEDIQQKAAAEDAGIDAATLSRGIHGLGPLDLNRLWDLPREVLACWFSLVLDAKVELETAEQERRRA